MEVADAGETIGSDGLWGLGGHGSGTGRPLSEEDRQPD